VSRPGGDVPGMKRFPYRSNGGIVILTSSGDSSNGRGARSPARRLWAAFVQGQAVKAMVDRQPHAICSGNGLDGRCSSRRRVKAPSTSHDQMCRQAVGGREARGLAFSVLMFSVVQSCPVLLSCSVQ
jgi:hypothetical protein